MVTIGTKSSVTRSFFNQFYLCIKTVPNIRLSWKKIEIYLPAAEPSVIKILIQGLFLIVKSFPFSVFLSFSLPDSLLNSSCSISGTFELYFSFLVLFLSICLLVSLSLSCRSPLLCPSICKSSPICALVLPQASCLLIFSRSHFLFT